MCLCVPPSLPLPGLWRHPKFTVLLNDKKTYFFLKKNADSNTRYSYEYVATYTYDAILVQYVVDVIFRT